MTGALLLAAGAAALVAASVLLRRVVAADPADGPLRPPLWVTAGLGVVGLCLGLAGALLL